MRVFPPASLFSPRRPEPLRVFSLSNLFFVLAHVQYRTFSAPNKTTHWGLPSVMGICYPRGYGFNLVRKRVRQVERTQESPGARRKLALTRILFGQISGRLSVERRKVVHLLKIVLWKSLNLRKHKELNTYNLYHF